MSGSPEMLFPDDSDDSPLLPARPREIAQPIARKSSAVAPSDRRLAFSPGGIAKGSRPDHVAIPVKPRIPTPEHLAIPVKPNLGFYDPTGRKLRTNKSAFRINPDSVVRSPLRKGEIPVRAQGPYMPGGRHRTKKAGRHSKGKLTRHKARVYRSRKASRPSTRATLRR
jgi:hypothetical protein